VAARPKAEMKPVVAALYTPQEQAAFVCQRLQELHEEEHIPYSDMAVLYRAHFQSMDVQLHLTAEGVPFQITSGLKFFELAHIKDFSAFLKFAVNPRDEAAFDRLVQMMPGVGAGSAAKMWSGWLPASRRGPGSLRERFPGYSQKSRCRRGRKRIGSNSAGPLMNLSGPTARCMSLWR
jgi:DNA helicase II / ATP-dependent DNA helicase PcrA